MMPSLHEQIQDQRSAFTPAQARIADYLLANTLDAALLTATELAQRVNVDPATVVRFAQKLGYKGYLDLKAALGRLVRNGTPAVSGPSGSLGDALERAHRSLSSTYHTVWDSLDRSELVPFLELFGLPCRLLLLCDRGSRVIVDWLAAELRERGFSVDAPADDPAALGESMLSTGSYDRALLIEGLEVSPQLEHLAIGLARKRIRSLGILGSSASQVGYHVDATLQLGQVLAEDTYPFVLGHLLGTLLHAVDQLHGAHQQGIAEDGEP